MSEFRKFVVLTLCLFTIGSLIAMKIIIYMDGVLASNMVIPHL